MTGYACLEHTLPHVQVRVEIKSLNSKQHAEVAMRLPHALQAWELQWRKHILSRMLRGKLSVAIDCVYTAAPPPASIVEATLFQERYAELLALAQSVKAGTHSLMSDTLRLPGVIQNTSSREALQPADVDAIQALLEEALDLCQAHRKQEGAAVEKVLSTHVKSLRAHLGKITALAPQRLEAIQQKLDTKLAAVRLDQAFDPARLTQELMLYAERLDISEEIERTEAHLDYFEQVMQNPTQPVGKRLGFVSQELVREINTMAAKAHHAVIQKETVCMKDIVERLKEQLHNVL